MSFPRGETLFKSRRSSEKENCLKIIVRTTIVLTIKKEGYHQGMSLKEELKMSSAFRSQRQEAQLSLMRTQAILEPGFNRIFVEHGLTAAQFNILRILKGDRSLEGMTCSDIGSRLISRDSDVTRLVDRLVKSRLVDRHRPEEDRRKVLVTITSRGTELIEKLLPILKLEEERALGHLTEKDLLSLILLLEKVRAPHI